MLPTNDTLSIDFTIDYDGHQFKLADTFDFVTANMDLANLRGIIKLTDPSGTVIYNNIDWNAPDVDHDVSLESAFISLIASVDMVTNKLIPGEYAVVYTLRYNYTVTGVTIGEILATVGSELGQSKIEAEGVTYVDLQEDDSILIEGSAANNGTYTVVDIEYDGANTWIFVEEVLVPSPDDTGTISWEIDRYYVKTFEYCLNFTKPIVDLVVTHDCDYLKLIGKDMTDRTGDTLLTRTMKVIYPTGVDGNPVETTLTSTSITDSSLTAPVLYTKKYTFTMTSTNSSVEDDGLILLYTLMGTQDHNVICESNLVGLKACLTKLYSYYTNDCANGVASRYACTVQQIDNLRVLGAIASAEGDSDAVAGYTADIKALLECAGIDCDCSVSDDYPVKVVSDVFTWTDTSKQDVITGATGSLFYIDADGDLVELTAGADGQIIEWQGGIPVNASAGNIIVNTQTSTGLPSVSSSFVLPADFFQSDGDGIEFEYAIRNTSGAFSMAVKEGATDYAALAIGSETTGIGKGSVIKSGTDLAVYHYCHASSIVAGSATIAGLDFSTAITLQVYANGGTLGGVVGLIVRKIKLIS